MAYKLGSVGIKGSLLKLINNMYNDCNYIIKSGGEFSNPIGSSLGVKQGCNLSPLLFNIFINDIHQIFNNACCPISINNQNISSLSFADDLVILSETEAGLKNSLKCLENYCNEWGLKVNAKKTKVMIFNKSFTKKIKSLNFSMDGAKIETTNSYCYLGIEMSNTGSFHKATDALYNKSLRALFSLYSAISIHSDEPNSKLYLKLFDSLIKPILLYGCEVWGPQITKTNNIISKFVNKFYKTVLGVPRYTSTTGIHIELGRFSIDVNVHASMLKYWARLITLPTSRLVSNCYWSLFNNPNNTDPWVKSIKEIIFASGQYHVWHNQKQLGISEPKFIRKHISYMSQNLKDQFIQKATMKMNSESKLVLFKNAKNTLSLSKYMSVINNREKRRLISKLRLGVLPLEIEKGRRSNLIRNDRHCKLCHTEQVEDETHFLLTCPSLAQYRQPFITSILELQPHFANKNSHQKINYLYFNESVPTNILVISSNLLYKLNNARDALNS